MATDKLSAFQVRRHVIALLELQFWPWNVGDIRGTHSTQFVSTFYLTAVPQFFFKRFISQTVHTVCTRRNYKIVPVTNLNKYLHYGTIICI